MIKALHTPKFQKTRTGSEKNLRDGLIELCPQCASGCDKRILTNESVN